MKPDKYHYHELLHTINIIREMCIDHLIDHHAGKLYENDILPIQNMLHDLYQKVSNDSDELFDTETIYIKDNPSCGPIIHKKPYPNVKLPKGSGISMGVSIK